MPNVTRHEKYVCTNIDANNNKFWEFWEYDDGSGKTRWGRVSDKDKTQEKDFPGGKNWDSVIASKLKKGYKKVDIVGDTEGTTIASAGRVSNQNIEVLAAKQIGRGNAVVSNLVKYLAQKNRHTITANTKITYNEATGLFQTPIGVVTQANIDDARNILAQIYDFVKNRDFENRTFKNSLQDYLMLIPSDVGRARGWHTTFLPDVNAVQGQNSILDALQASLDMVISGNTTDKNDKKTKTAEEKVFDVMVEPINDAKEISRIKDKYGETRQRQHVASKFNVKKVFSVQINAMHGPFQKNGKKVGNVKELWHGSQASNILSILAKGMMIPPSSAAHVCGRMFGDGLYFSDQSTKSLNYAAGYWGGSRDSSCYMFLVDVAMGKEYVPRGSFGGRCPKEYDSTFAKAGKSGVMNNEMIVYQTCQANITRLVEFG